MSLPRYAEYRDSGVAWLGEVPAHWDFKRIRFVAELNPSKREVADLERDTEVSFLPMDAIGDDGSIRLDETRFLSQVESGYTYFRDGDVVIAKITPCFENGKGAVVRGLLDGVGFGTTELIVVRPKPSATISEYLGWLFASPTFRNVAEGAMYGAGGQKRVPDDFVRDFAVAFPSIDEQTAIAAFLDRETGKIDALIAEQEKLLTLLAEKRQATISHAVTRGLDPSAPMKDSSVPWLGEVPAHWELGSLKRFWSVTDCKHVTAEFVEDGIPLASIREVQAQFVDLVEAKRTTESFYEQLTEGGRDPRPGDLIFSRNATVGEVAQVPSSSERFAMGQDVCLLRRTNKSMSPDYMQYVIRSSTIVEQLNTLMIGSTFKRVNVEQIRSLIVPNPPKSEQLEISFYVGEVIGTYDALAQEAIRAIILMRERRSALIAAAVTGKIDVRQAA